MNDFLETKTITITPVTPIFISGGENKFERNDIVLTERRLTKLHFINEDMLGKLLVEKRLAKKYLSFIKIPTSTIQQFLAENIINPVTEKWLKNIKLIDYSINIYDKQKFIRNGFGKTFIPGSSIKGAIRTAIIWAMLRENKYDIEKYIIKTYTGLLNKRATFNKEKWDQLITNTQTELNGFYSLKDSRYMVRTGLNINDIVKLMGILCRIKKINQKQVRYIDEELITSAFSDYDITADVIENGRKKKETFSSMKNAMTNFMKCIQVKDTTPIKVVNAKSKVFSLKEDGNFLQEGNPNTIEVFNNGAINFTISFDKQIFEMFVKKSKEKKFIIPFNNLDELLRIVEEFYNKVWEEEKSFFVGDLQGKQPAVNGNINLFKETVDFYKSPNVKPNFRLGWGGGLLSVTVFNLLRDDYRKAIRNVIKDRNNTVAPKSRRLVQLHDDSVLPLGWIKLNVGGKNGN